jgi:hypothetical protein
VSSSQLFVFRDGIATPDETYRNSHGTATFIWNALLKKHKETLYPGGVPEYLLLDEDSLGRLLEKKFELLAPWELAVLDWTLDRALIRNENVSNFADHLDRFEESYQLGDRVCHLKSIASRLRALEAPFDAVGLYATSVGENLWFHPLPEEAWEENGEEERPYDLNKDSDHFYVEVPSAS